MGRAMIRLLLIRHGVTEWNQEGRWQGHQDIPLGELGRRQAEQLALRLQTETIDAAYTSDLARARDTAVLAMAGREVAVEEAAMLREMSFGAWEGLRYDEIAARFPADWGAWVRDPVGMPTTKGESLGQLRERLTTFYESVAEPMNELGEPRDWFSYRAAGQATEQRPRTLLFVTHGGPVRILLTALLDIPPERYWRFAIRPASLSILDVYPEGAIAEVIGDTSHLSP
jgi:broad specificity phosphatase PhoE